MISKDKISKIVADSVKKLVIEELPGRIEDAINEHMYEMVEDEVSRYTEYKLSMTLENVSKTHGIPLDLLLRDVPETNKSGGCKGTKTSFFCETYLRRTSLGDVRVRRRLRRERRDALSEPFMMATVDTKKLRGNGSRGVTSQVKIYTPTDQSR